MDLQLLVAVCILLLTVWLYYQLIGRRRGLPPGPTPWPFVGNLLQLDHKVPVHKSIIKWANQYGPLITVWIGPKPLVVVTKFALLKEYFKKRYPDILPGKPKQNFLTAFMHGGYYGFGGVSGDKWKEQRRFTVRTLRDFGLGQNLMEKKVAAEVARLLNNTHKLLGDKSSGVVSLDETLEACVCSVVSSIINGSSYEVGNDNLGVMKRAIDANMKLIVEPGFRTMVMLPWLRFLPFFNHFGFDHLKKNRATIWAVVEADVLEHEKNLDVNAKPTNFIDAYLKELHDRQTSGADMGYFCKRQLEMMLIDLWIGGMETTYTILRWMMLYLLKYPEIQARIKREIRGLTQGVKRPLGMTDRRDLPYTAATVNEGLRYANIVSFFGLEHAGLTDVEIEGYHIPQGMIILPCFACVHEDPESFQNPEKFEPLRFLEDDEKTLKKVEELLPFSVGKRACPAEGLAGVELFLIFSNFLQHFTVSIAPEDQNPSLEPIRGITSSPKKYKVLLQKDD